MLHATVVVRDRRAAGRRREDGQESGRPRRAWHPTSSTSWARILRAGTCGRSWRSGRNTLKIGLIAGFRQGGHPDSSWPSSPASSAACRDSVIRIISDSPADACPASLDPGHHRLERGADDDPRSWRSTVAALAWMFPCRTIRSQVLSIRERSYVEVARANGAGLVRADLQRRSCPTSCRSSSASFVGAVAVRCLAAIGLEALGLGAIQTQTSGVTIYWSQEYTAVLRGFWWWWGPPIAMIAFIFLALFVTLGRHDRSREPTTPSRLMAIETPIPPSNQRRPGRSPILRVENLRSSIGPAPATSPAVDARVVDAAPRRAARPDPASRAPGKTTMATALHPDDPTAGQDHRRPRRARPARPDAARATRRCARSAFATSRSCRRAR